MLQTNPNRYRYAARIALAAGCLTLAAACDKNKKESGAPATASAETTTQQAAKQAPAKKADGDPTAAPSDVAAPPADAEKTASGLASKVLKPGTGTDMPSASSTVTVHYSGWTTDGKLFDSSYKRGQPASFPLNRVIAGWTEGLQLMKKGEKRRFWIPEALAYRGMPGKPAGMLVFDVELLDVQAPPAAARVPETPEDVAKPPRKAKRTKSGLAYRILKKGDGERPKATDRVRVHYSGWTTDGKLFDSSYKRGQPASFGLNQVIPGWTEGVQLMKEGAYYRFWIPGKLAYEGRRGPQGTLVFDVELLEVL